MYCAKSGDGPMGNVPCGVEDDAFAGELGVAAVGVWAEINTNWTANRPAVTKDVRRSDWNIAETIDFDHKD